MESVAYVLKEIINLVRLVVHERWHVGTNAKVPVVLPVLRAIFRVIFSVVIESAATSAANCARHVNFNADGTAFIFSATDYAWSRAPGPHATSLVRRCSTAATPVSVSAGNCVHRFAGSASNTNNVCNNQSSSSRSKISARKRDSSFCSRAATWWKSDTWIDGWKNPNRRRSVSQLVSPARYANPWLGFVRDTTRGFKTYMIQMNDVKRMSTDANRLRFQINNAVSNIWPSDGVSDAMNRLTSTETEEDKLKLQRLARGAACVWLESFKVLQICKRKNANVEMEVESLEKAKTELISAFQSKSLNDLGASVIALYKIYLLMHVRRLQTFIKDPRKVYLLKTIGSELTKESDVNWLELATTNIQLGTNFSLKQKENVDDYMKHLESFFNPADLNVRKWLICSQGMIQSHLH